MRTLYFHIGAHKTGSTALQKGLHAQRATLRELGYGLVHTKAHAHLHSFLGFGRGVKPTADGVLVMDPEGLEQRFALPKAKKVLVSEENFAFFFNKDRIEALHTMLRRHFDDIRIICYIRRQDRHAVSHHQQGAKPKREIEGVIWGHSPTALPTPSDAHDLYLDYDRHFGLWGDVFGDQNVILRVYDRKLLTMGDTLSDFLSIVGIDPRLFKPQGDTNVSLGSAQTKTGHLMNEVRVEAGIARAVLASIGPGGKLLPSQAEARAFMDRYRESNRRLNDRFKISDLPDLFNDDYADYPETPHNDWTEDGANAALRAVIAELGHLTAAMKDLTADDLRDAAIALKSTKPAAALRLIEAAYSLRPGGTVIQEIRQELLKPAVKP